MSEQDFFSIYLPALEKALANDHVNHGFNVLGPDWYIENKTMRKKIDAFEEKNFEKYQALFESISLYFDAKSHNFDEINGIKTSEYKSRLIHQISLYKKKFTL